MLICANKKIIKCLRKKRTKSIQKRTTDNWWKNGLSVENSHIWSPYSCAEPKKLGVVRKLSHARKRFFDPHSPLSQIFNKKRFLVIGQVLEPFHFKRDVICEGPPT